MPCDRWLSGPITGPQALCSGSHTRVAEPEMVGLRRGWREPRARYQGGGSRPSRMPTIRTNGFISGLENRYRVQRFSPFDSKT